MKNIKFTILLVLLSLSFASAQDSYFGVGLSAYTDFTNLGALPSFQFGTSVSDSVELRATVDSVILASIIGVDLLYSEQLPKEDARYYLGGGADFVFALLPGIVNFAAAASAHATLGYESISDNVGIFAEAQPMVAFSGGIGVRLRLGANIHF